MTHWFKIDGDDMRDFLKMIALAAVSVTFRILEVGFNCGRAFCAFVADAAETAALDDTDYDTE